ncbi:AMP-binding protein, partial [Ciceribacter naphthalenivorans]|uniref:AMP-binding protein n=2 Tax=Pseudomonadota TaxID=1224 RepID=UPI0011BFAF84
MDIIRKSDVTKRQANLADYDQFCAAFHWKDAECLLDGLPGGKLNIAFEAIDRHVIQGRGDGIAIRWISKDGTRRDFSYVELQRETNRFANVLKGLGIVRGDRVYSLLGRVPELYVAALGTLKYGAVFCPMFSAFGPEPVKARMEIGGARVLVTSHSLYKKKVAPWRKEFQGLDAVLLIDAGDEVEPHTHELPSLMAKAATEFPVAAAEPEDMALLHFTSGTTGRPKGAVHVHRAVVAHHITGKLALDLHPDDVFWCTADPGWVTGTSYGIISPLTNGATMIVDEAEFDAGRWYGILESEKVNVWYTAPTAIRMLMKAGSELAKAHDLSRLRFMASVGEPLNP